MRKRTYLYDSIGNLVKDVSEEIDSIIWNVYGKIDRVVRKSTSSRSDLEFRYDAMGSRICKIVKPRTGGSGILDQDEWTYTYYMRDASGNVIATYDRDYSTPGGTYGDTLSLTENHLYGSSRIGIRSVTEVVCTTTYTYVSTGSNGVFVGTYSSRTATAASTTNFNHELRRKAYELSNHLGNVLTTVSDARNPVNASGTITTFGAVTLSAQDYYAFGSSMAGRSYTSSSYRYTFNGKEKDSETELQDYGMRIYNERLGRFLSVDPLTRSYPMLTPYQFASDQPITSIDLDGLEQYIVTYHYDANNVLTHTTIYSVVDANGVAQDLNLRHGNGTGARVTDQNIAVFENRNGVNTFVGGENQFDAGTSNGSSDTQNAQAHGDESNINTNAQNVTTSYVNYQIPIAGTDILSGTTITGNSQGKRGDYTYSKPTYGKKDVFEPASPVRTEWVTGSGLDMTGYSDQMKYYLDKDPENILYVGSGVAPSTLEFLQGALGSTYKDRIVQSKDLPLKTGCQADSTDVTLGKKEEEKYQTSPGGQQQLNVR